MTVATLHAVTAEEAEQLALRAEALRRFAARYRHNAESQRAMLGGLRRLATGFSAGRLDERTFPWELLVDDDLTQVMWSQVADGYSRNTAAKDASALRTMLDCCRRVGLITHEEYQLARGFQAKGGQARPPAGQYLSEADVADIVGACQTEGGETTRIRDTALILTLASTGARGEELTGVPVQDVHLAERRVWLARTKSGEPRNAWLHPQAVAALRPWLQVRGAEPGPLFVPLSRTGRPLQDRGGLSTHQVWKVVRRRAHQAGKVGVTPHDLRRFLITTLLERGVDLVLVARVVGHKNTTTTAGYDRRPQQRQRDAVATLSCPPSRGSRLGDRAASRERKDHLPVTSAARSSVVWLPSTSGRPRPRPGAWLCRAGPGAQAGSWRASTARSLTSGSLGVSLFCRAVGLARVPLTTGRSIS